MVRIQHVFELETGHLPSDRFEPSVLYVCHDDSTSPPYIAKMLCPCGCGAELGMLVERHGNLPCWDLREGPSGEATLAPSIQHTAGCRSHFFLTDGQVRWC